MALFGGPKNYASIVAPLKKMVADLGTYIEEQKKKITDLTDQKTKIEEDIALSESEIAKSNFTTGKINDLLGSDLDADGIADVDELPDDSTSEIDIQQ